MGSKGGVGGGTLSLTQDRRVFFDLWSDKWVFGATGILFKMSRNWLCFFAMSDMAGGMEQDIKIKVNMTLKALV